jgi:hypothetical protein
VPVGHEDLFFDDAETPALGETPYQLYVVEFEPAIKTLALPEEISPDSHADARTGGKDALKRPCEEVEDLVECSTVGVESCGAYRGHATSRRREKSSTKRSRKSSGSRTSASRSTMTSPVVLRSPRFLPLATGRSPWRIRTPANCQATAIVPS